jgi:hypothetical protein
MQKSSNLSIGAGILLFSLSAIAADKGGNGGDICEDRFKSVRDDIASWIEKGGSANLVFPSEVTLAQYNEQMLKYISDPTHIPRHPFKASIQCVSDKVLVNGAEKTCRNDKDPQTGAASIVCNIDRFNQTGDSDQYVLVHHEYAGLAGIEVNDGQDSQYPISNQISGYLENEIVKKLAIKPTIAGNITVNLQCDTFGSIETATLQAPDATDCKVTLPDNPYNERAYLVCSKPVVFTAKGFTYTSDAPVNLYYNQFYNGSIDAPIYAQDPSFNALDPEYWFENPVTVTDPAGFSLDLVLIPSKDGKTIVGGRFWHSTVGGRFGNSDENCAFTKKP